MRSKPVLDRPYSLILYYVNKNRLYSSRGNADSSECRCGRGGFDNERFACSIEEQAPTAPSSPPEISTVFDRTAPSPYSREKERVYSSILLLSQPY